MEMEEKKAKPTMKTTEWSKIFIRFILRSNIYYYKI